MQQMLSSYFSIVEKKKAALSTPFSLSLRDFVLEVHPQLQGSEFLWKEFHSFLEEIYTKTAKRELENPLVIINMPPRFSKTLWITYYVAWCFLMNPRAQFIYVTYSQKLSLQVSDEIKRVLSLYKQQCKLAKTAAQLWKTEQGGGFWATTIMGAVTGFGAGDLYASNFSGELIIDDPQNPHSAFYQVQRDTVIRAFFDTFWSRRNNQSRIPIIVNQQRVHVEDLSGHLINANVPHHRLCIKALDENGDSVFPEKVSTKDLLTYKEASPYSFWAQQMQEPRAYAGGFFNTEKLAIMSVAEYKKIAWHLKFFVRSWDLAGVKKISMGNIERRDFTRGVLLGTDGKLVYIMDLKTHKGTVEGNELLIAKTAKEDGFQVMITVPEDPGVAGQHYVDYLQKSPSLLGYSLNAVRPTQNKQLRAAPFASYLNLGKVVLVSDEEDQEKWNLQVLEELQSFPTGYHDDIIDALSDAFHIIHDVKSFV